MKRKTIYILIAIILLLSLFFPFKWSSYEDGSREYSALLIKYVSWTMPKEFGDEVVNTSTFEVYFFPDNLKSYEDLRKDFYGE